MRKLLISNFYKWLRTVLQSFLPSNTVQQPPPSTQRSKGGRRPINVDCGEAYRLRCMGWNDYRIARQLGVSRNTITTRLRDYVSPIPPTPPPQAQPAFEATDKPPVVYLKPPNPAAPVQPSPVPIPQVLPPMPHGLDSVPNGSKAFFLVNGKANADLAMHLAQPAIGIERWHETYASLPAFQRAERIWVVMNSSEENRSFFQSIVASLWIREKCLVSVDNGATPNNQPMQFRNWVQNIAKHKLLMDRTHDGSWPETDVSGFEQVHNFQPLPLPSHTDKIAALCKRFEAEIDSSVKLDWRH
jgi:hypothetical protein